MENLSKLVSGLGRYAKTLIALGAFLTLAGTALTDLNIDSDEAFNLMVALAAVFGVYLVPNKKG